MTEPQTPGQDAREERLRSLLGDSPAPGRLDAPTIIRRSRRWRIARATTLSTISVLAAAGVVFTAAEVLPRPGVTSYVASDMAETEEPDIDRGAGAASSDLAPFSADCAVGDAAAASPALDITVQLPAVLAPGTEARTIIALENTGQQAVTAHSAWVDVRFAAGATLTRGERRELPLLGLSLEPGASVTTEAGFAAVECASGEPLRPGSYEVLVSVTLYDADGVQIDTIQAPPEPLLVG